MQSVHLTFYKIHILFYLTTSRKKKESHTYWDALFPVIHIQVMFNKEFKKHSLIKFHVAFEDLLSTFSFQFQVMYNLKSSNPPHRHDKRQVEIKKYQKLAKFNQHYITNHISHENFNYSHNSLHNMIAIIVYNDRFPQIDLILFQLGLTQLSWICTVMHHNSKKLHNQCCHQ